MSMEMQLKTAQDYLDAADQEFENADALAATERLWEAAQQALITAAEGKGWSYDRDDLYPVAENLAKADEQMGEILLTTFFAVGGYPDKVRFNYFMWDDGDSHRMLRTVREFVEVARRLAE